MTVIATETQAYPRTTCWSPEQKPVVDFLSSALAQQIHFITQRILTSIGNPRKLILLAKDNVGEMVEAHCNIYGPHLKTLDKRPNQVYSDAQPEVFFPYTSQALLEDLICACEDIGVNEEIVQMLKDSV